jgi:hypothetical protein
MDRAEGRRPALQRGGLDFAFLLLDFELSGADAM